MTVQVVILAAGLGTRLARPHPKPLTQLDDGRTILQQQVENLTSVFGKRLRLTVVVGYKLDLVMEHVPDASFVYNESFDQTNTSKSLLKALKNSTKGGVLWLNGDVVFAPDLLELLKPFIASGQSAVMVNTASVSHEEVKYTTGTDGYIRRLSKTIPICDAEGEAVGINYISQKDKKNLIRRLRSVADQDFFERAMEKTIKKDMVSYRPVDTSRYLAIEIDSPEDLLRANHAISQETPWQNTLPV